MIGLKKVRDLHVVDEDGKERDLPIAAASALLRVGDYLLVLSDDERQMAIFEEGSDEPGLSSRSWKAPRRAARTSAPITSPTSSAWPTSSRSTVSSMGRFSGMGSGSAPDRNQATLLRLASDGRPDSDFKVVDLGPLYDRLREDIVDLNIEGSAVVGDVFRLMQRGNGPEGRNARVDLDADTVRSALAGGEPHTTRRRAHHRVLRPRPAEGRCAVLLRCLPAARWAHGLHCISGDRWRLRRILARA